MASFMSTIEFTKQGKQNVKDTCVRAEEFVATAADLGVTVKQLAWCLGVIDGVLIFDAPDELVAAAAMVHLSSGGNVHTQTTRLFDANEMQQVLSKLP